MNAAIYPEVHPSRRPRTDGGPTRTIVFLHGGATGNWSWHRQVEAFGDYRVLTPHLPGYGARRGEPWQGLESAADDVAAFVAERVDTGVVHLVGISLGGLVGLRVLERHPELVGTAFLTGLPVLPQTSAQRAAARTRPRMWGADRFVRTQAGAYGALETAGTDDAEAATLRAVAEDVARGGAPQLDGLETDVLLAAGAREPAFVRKGLAELQRAIPRATVRLAPGAHHAWNLEEPLLFDAVVRRWAERTEPHPRLGEA
ncbi:alpha/beta fold hydrolase [Zhihengliuella sp.]|uniref:alpha/beta fold hydrolase n=1 Tax=Zhihengliuella sp. TaxID=1954483 RepID=UPI002811E3B8|nr:alpha/beta fold hydrolase [Zhihengliuella sp.]